MSSISAGRHPEDFTVLFNPCGAHLFEEAQHAQVALVIVVDDFLASKMCQVVPEVLLVTACPRCGKNGVQDGGPTTPGQVNDHVCDDNNINWLRKVARSHGEIARLQSTDIEYFCFAGWASSLGRVHHHCRYIGSIELPLWMLRGEPFKQVALIAGNIP